jgi:hypothetical protein
MFPIRFLTYLLLFYVYIPSTLAGQELTVYVEQCTGDTDTFIIDYLTITCDDYCTWGSNGTYYGSYTLGDDVSTETPVVTNKIWGLTHFHDTVDICDDGSVVNDNGDQCPGAGTYDYLTEASLPGSPGSWYSFFASWMSFTVHSTIDFGDAVVVCEIKIKGMGYDSSSSSYMTKGSALMVFGFAAAFRMKKRRIIVTEDEQEGNGSATRFVEMTTA